MASCIVLKIIHFLDDLNIFSFEVAKGVIDTTISLVCFPDKEESIRTMEMGNKEGTFTEPKRLLCESPVTDYQFISTIAHQNIATYFLEEHHILNSRLNDDSEEELARGGRLEGSMNYLRGRPNWMKYYLGREDVEPTFPAKMFRRRFDILPAFHKQLKKELLYNYHCEN